MADSQATDLARYEFKRALEELGKAHGRATELVSVYVPAGKPISDVTNYLRSEYSQSTNIKSSSTRKNVTGAISSLLAELKRFGNVAPETGIALFVGAKAVGADKSRMVKHVVLPPEPVTSFLYRCDSQFFLEPLEKMLHDRELYGLVVIDRNEATIGLLYGERIDVVKNFQSNVPRKHTMGGQSQRRLERLIEEAAENFFKKIGHQASDVFLAKEGLKGVLIGGPGYTKTYWASQDFLHHEIKKKIVNTFDTGYTDEHGLKELVQNAGETLRELGLTRERDILQRFLREIVKDGGLGAYGEAHVRHVLEIGAVDTLVLSEKLRKFRATIRCESCGYERQETTGDLDKLAEAIDRCPQCKAPIGITDSRDIVEELTEMAGKTGSRVMIVSDDTEEGKNFFQAFGGMGALLRFRVAQA